MYFKHIQYVKAKEDCRGKKDFSHGTSLGGKKFWEQIHYLEVIKDQKL
jgi:hypothetical protein